jgi:DNA polymerase III epsilon subunit-like protein
MTQIQQNVMVDIESDGPCPGKHSMICFGAVIVEPGLQRTFYAELKPISEEFLPDALAISGFSREECKKFPDPRDAMQNFEIWLQKEIPGRRPIFWSDNNGYDFAFINYYFWQQLNRNPFGWSSANLGSFWKGMEGNLYSTFKHLRETKHTHHPVDDARGNAEALLKMFDRIKYK